MASEVYGLVLLMFEHDGLTDFCRPFFVIRRKSMPNLTLSGIRTLHRDDVECDLDFAGFLIISTPLRPESKGVIHELHHASHHVSTCLDLMGIMHLIYWSIDCLVAY